MLYKKEDLSLSLDRKNLLFFLFKYYNTTDLSNIKTSLKKDLRNKIKIGVLSFKSGYSIQELIICLIAIFGYELFNKALIKKIKYELKDINFEHDFS